MLWTMLRYTSNKFNMIIAKPGLQLFHELNKTTVISSRESWHGFLQ